MSMTEIIDSMTDGGFTRYMNVPEPPDGQAYISYDKNNAPWVTCPYCSKRNLKIKGSTSISDLELKCKGSNCKKNFLINLKEGKAVER